MIYIYDTEKIVEKCVLGNQYAEDQGSFRITGLEWICYVEIISLIAQSLILHT